MPSKYEHNVISIGHAIEIMGKMPSGPPTTSLLKSTQGLVSAVDKLVAARARSSGAAGEPGEAVGLPGQAEAATLDGDSKAATVGEDSSEGCGDHNMTDEVGEGGESFTSFLTEADLGALVTDPFDTALFWQ